MSTITGSERSRIQNVDNVIVGNFNDVCRADCSMSHTAPVNTSLPVPGKAPKPVDEAPKFVPFAGGGARLDGKRAPAKGAAEEKGKEGDGASRQSA